MDDGIVKDDRATLWRTSWGVVLATSGAFTLGYGASHSAHPSIGASRPPIWPLFISTVVVLVSLWFVFAPRLHQWPFAEPAEPEGETPEPWLEKVDDAAP